MLENFQDDEFEFSYKPIDPVAVKKFNEKASQFIYELNVEQDYLLTKTVGLFDKHLAGKNTKFYGMQTHFHAPSEHSIDGNLLDLEMHIVHGIQSDLTPDKEGGAQFSNGVLGFLFKVVPDSYFKTHDDFHDDFLYKLA